MKTIVIILCGLALLLSAVATFNLLRALLYQGVATHHSENGVETIETTMTLVEMNGNRVIFLLVGVTLASGLPLLAGLALPSAQRIVTWIFALLLLAFSIAGSMKSDSLTCPAPFC